MEIGKQLRISVVSVVVLTVVLGIVYPSVMTAVGQVAFAYQANGSLIRAANGTVVGSEILAQGFKDAKYFHPRPSAAGQNGYHATDSGGSNLGPTNKKLIDGITAAAKAYREENGLAPDALVPVDAVTASGSGLDPDISLANADLQAPRVAKARGMTLAQVRTAIDRLAQEPVLGFFGTPRVNVLLLNLELDRAKH